MSEIPCPSCGGNKQLQIVHVKYAPGCKGPPVTEMPCVVCNGKGTVSEERERRMESGGQFHNYRVDVLGLGLREAAKRWGFSPTELSRIEQGLIKTDWVPPGFQFEKVVHSDDVQSYVEPKLEESIPASDLRKAIEPVADWFECEEGDPIPLIEIVSEIAKMLAEERQDTLRYRQALQDIIKHQEIVAGPSMARMSTTIMIAKKALRDDDQ